jgi:membrane-bound serine protease (ClpP class)
MLSLMRWLTSLLAAVCLLGSATLADAADDDDSAGSTVSAADDDSAGSTVSADDDVGDDDDSAPAPAPAKAVAPGPIRVIRFPNYMINRGTETWFLEELARAEQDSAAAFVLVMDTPGGAVASMEEMVKAELAADVPVVVYVAPTGGAASSAGTFITMAAHVAAMAPATTIGAAHPVFATPSAPAGGEESEDDKANKASSEEAMLHKVTNHLVATIRNIADERGRNADWAEAAVREAVAIGADEAVEKNVVDLKANNLSALLSAIDGRQITLHGGRKHTLRTTGPLQESDIPLRLLILLFLGNPTVAFGLLSLGMTLLVLEGKTGAMVPGIAGMVCLVVAAFGLSFVPVNLVAVALVVVGFGLLLAEIYVGSFGVMGVGGIAAIAFGGLFLVKKTPEFDVGVNPGAIVTVVVLASMTVGLLATLVVRTERQPAKSGEEGMVGQRGVVKRLIPGGRETGRVFVRSELWTARSEEPIAAGADVIVEAIDGMTLTVREAKA